MERAREARETPLLCLLRRMGPSSSESESFATAAEVEKDVVGVWGSGGNCCELQDERRVFGTEVSDTSEALSAEGWIGWMRVSGYSSSKRWMMLFRVLSRKIRRPEWWFVRH